MSASGRYSRTSGSLRTRTVQNESPYNRPLTNHGLVDKTSMIWRDFMNGVRKRKLLIERLKEAALEPTTHPSLLKRLMIEIRQLSLRVIEDGLEIEYRSQLTDKNGRPKAANLPPISAFRRMEEKDDVLSLAEMICDIDEIFHISSIKEMLPYQFPETRNPFMLGRSVDDLANLVPPHPEPGNTDEELKALELLRYKRASKALIRAEAQVANKLPINLQDVEKLLFEMIDDPNVEKLVRSVSTLLDNDGPDYGREAQWISLHSPQFHIEAHELLTKLNAYKGDHPMRVDVQAAIRQTLRDTNLEFLEDKTAIFLVEWVNSVLSRTLSRANRRDSTTAYSKRSHLTSPKRMGSARESAFHLNRGAQNLMSYEVIAVRPLSRENLQAHNEEYEELASIVSKMGMDIKETNYVEKPTRLKMQIHQEFQTSSTPEPKDPWIPAGVINSLSRSNLNTPAVGKRVSSPPRSPIASPTPIVSFTPNIPKLTVGDDVSVSSVGGGSVGNRSGKIGQSRLKQEIEKVIHELGLTNGKTAKSPYALKTINDFDSDYGDDENPDPNTLSSIRYQVAKMQQELLRRNVLDPKHFKVESVDTRNMRQKGLTVVDPDDAYSAPSKKAEPEEHLMFERDIVVGEMEKLCLDFVLDVTNEKLVGRINEFSLQEVTQDHVEFSLISSKKPPPKKVKSCIAYMPISKLMFNRLTDELFSVLYDGYESTKRKLLRVLSDHLQEKALQDPIPTGKLLITANRVLFQSVFTENGVVVDLVIMRNDDCNGLNVICTPLSGLSVGQASSGPVTIVIYDNELQVLLINQYGLYKMCLSRWSGMEAVAQWLSSRIIIRKVKTSDLALLPPKVEDQLINADTISISSEVTFGTAQNLPAVPDEAVVESKQMPDTIQNQMSKTMAEIRANKKALWMLDASIDRRVEISNAVLLQWKSRNVPAIAGATAKIRAIQDLEMLRFGVSLIIPTRKAFREIIPSTNKNELADLAEQSDDEDDEEEDSKPVEIHLEYRLTSAELLVFGSCDTSEKMKSVALGSVKSDEKHPEAFIWNILSRLKIVFKGSKKEPYKAPYNMNEQDNWTITYNRKLVREVKTVSQAAMILSVSTVGTELMIESELIDNNIYRNVEKKLLRREELEATIHSEGWSARLMDFERRRDLAVLLLEKLKVIEACGIHRLELYSFPETKLLQVVLKGSAHEKPLELGTVEISHHYTLSDLRIIIRKELEFEEVPRNFRIFYRNNICAIRQEPFRRAWELLPKCYIVAKAIAEVVVKEELSLATSPTSKKTKKKKEVDKNKLKPGQRRVLGKLVPVPISTLCQVKENSGVIYFLHDSRNFIAPGDVIRIGNVLGRDYIVMDPGNNEINTYPKTVKIEPVYDLLEEEDFDVPLQGNFPFPSNAGMLQGVIPLLRPPTELGFEYETLDDEKSIDIDDSVSKQSDAKEKVRNRSIQSVLTEFSQEEEKLMVGGKLEGNLINGTSQGLTRKKRVDQTFHDCWLWKCIPPKEDHRPKWRQLYDDGMVRYRYTHSYSDKYEMHFRVKAMHNYLEVLCTDARCDSLTLHKQRVNEMSNILVDFYTEVAFDRMTDWNPSYKKGIERSKFIKLMRDVEAFPDLKRPARIAQLDMLFMREAKGEFGIVQKFIMYQGFCRLLQDVALLRFPQQKKMNVTTDSSNGKEDGGALEDDEQSLAESITSIGSVSMKSSKSTITAENKKGRFAQILKTNKNDTPSVLQNAKTDKQTAAAAKAVEKALAGIDPTHKAYAYEKFVTDFVMTYGDWYESAWDVAKFAAMKKEAIPYCAATRIQAKFRGGFWHHSYFQYRINLIKLQANIRRKLSAKKTKYYYDLLLQDWIFRERYYGALLMQSVIRRFLKRCWYTKVMEKVKLQQVQVQKARRFKLKKLKKLHKKGVIYKEAKRVNGVMVFIKVTRKDSRNFTRDYGVNIEVYTPTSQSQYVFLVEEADLRSYMQLELEVPALTVGELLDVRNLKRVVASRLMIYKPNFKHALPQVLFSKHGLGVRGEKSLTRGKMIEGELFVCKIFETGDDVTIQCYHRLSCKVFKTSMGTAEVRDWIIEEHKINAIDELERDKEPLVLRPDQKKSFYNWLLNHLAIDTRQGTFRVLFARQLMRSQKLEMIIKIQSVWRRALVRPTIVSLLDQFMLKVKVSGDDWTSYYLNLKTGASSWDKPFLLGPLDLPTEPSRRWVPIYFYNLDGNLEKQYVNPYTGKYTALTPREAAVRIQRLARNFLLKPISMSLEEFKKAAHIFRNAAKEYEEVNPKKLKTVINYALVMHLILLDEPAAKPLYAEAVDLSESNPLVTRSFAFYLLGTCESPLKVNRDRAAILLGDAYRKDPTHSRFQVAYCMFKFACLRKPKDTRTLLNLALVHCMIYEENHIAEKLLRRALAIAPFDMRVMEIWNFLKERFPERQLIYNPVSRVNKIVANVQGKKRVVHGRPVVEDSQWAGWCYVPEDTYAASKYCKDVPYWYNPADGTELIEQPDFAEQWIVRKNRSEFIVDESGLEQYYDPLTAVYFQYHPLTDTYQ